MSDPGEPKQDAGIRCPYCKSADFEVCGFVYHRQPYDGLKNEYGTSKVFWDVDFPEFIEYRNPDCTRDVTNYFVKRRIIKSVYRAAKYDPFSSVNAK